MDATWPKLGVKSKVVRLELTSNSQHRGTWQCCTSHTPAALPAKYSQTPVVGVVRLRIIGTGRQRQQLACIECGWPNLPPEPSTPIRTHTPTVTRLNMVMTQKTAQCSTQPTAPHKLPVMPRSTTTRRRANSNFPFTHAIHCKPQESNGGIEVWHARRFSHSCGYGNMIRHPHTSHKVGPVWPNNASSYPAQSHSASCICNRTM